jgi:antitoxin (DNA-binding transcriptional repressor) of toxin-antitoxin stability system
MHAVAIRDLKNNPSTMTRYLDEGHSVFVTRHGKPIGITLPIGDDVFSVGLKKAVALDLYRNGSISLGKMAQMLEIPRQEAMGLLNRMEIGWIEDDPAQIEAEVARWL